MILKKHPSFLSQIRMLPVLYGNLHFYEGIVPLFKASLQQKQGSFPKKQGILNKPKALLPVKEANLLNQ
jgi:predicted rRNA methylase YqxC with S4 and FtsJ domains